jgi:hypothetical protein
VEYKEVKASIQEMNREMDKSVRVLQATQIICFSIAIWDQNTKCSYL